MAKNDAGTISNRAAASSADVTDQSLQREESRFRAAVRSLRSTQITTADVARLVKAHVVSKASDISADDVRRMLSRQRDAIRETARASMKPGKSWSPDEAVTALLVEWIRESYRPKHGQTRQRTVHFATALSRVAEYVRTRPWGQLESPLSALIGAAFAELEQALIEPVLFRLVEHAVENGGLPEGTLVRVDARVTDGSSGHPTARIGVVTDSARVVLDRAVSWEGAPPAWVSTELRLSTARGEHVVAIRSPAQHARTLEPGEADMFGEFLDLVAFGLPWLRKHLEDAATRTEAMGRFEAASASMQTPLVLWLLAKALAITLNPLAETAAHGEFFHPGMRSPEGPPDLTSVVSTTSLPWDEPGGRPFSLSVGQLISGYASQMNATLALSRTVGALRKVVTDLNYETLLARSSEIALVSLPLGRSGPGPSSVLYLWSPPIEEEVLQCRVRLLQFAVPFIGAIFERSVRNSQQRPPVMLGIGPAGAKVFTERVDRHVGILLQDAIARHELDRKRLRVACLVVKASSDTPNATARDWFAAQLPRLEPRSFISAWVDEGTVPEPKEYVVGHVTSDVLLIFLPIWLDQREIHNLRRLPTRVNGARPARTREQLQLGTLMAWVFDVSWSELHKFGGAAGSELVAMGREVATALDYIVSAHAQHLNGDWEAALDSVSRGLQVAPTNAYLLRRKVVFSLICGRIDEAVAAGERAVAAAPRSVRALCFLGDALMCSGELAKSIERYVAAMEENFDHPLPHASIGNALVMVARLLHGHVELGEDGARIAGALAGAANMSLALGRRREPVELAPRARSTDHAFWRAALLTRNVPQAIHRLLATLKYSPWDDEGLRELLLLRMQEYGAIAKHMHALRDSAVLEKIVSMASTASRALSRAIV